MLSPALLLLLPLHAGEGAPRPEEYGFEALINSKLNDGVQLLQAADVDSDGDVDLAVINNPKARIDFLLQRNAGEPIGDDAATRRAGRSINELVDEVHFRRDSFPTEQKVSSLAIADLNGDGRNDLAFLGDSGKLTIAYRKKAGGKESFGDLVRFDLDDPSNISQAVRCGDLDGDGRVDVLVLGKKKTALFTQGADGRLVAGTELLNASSSADGFALADLDGDRRLDLVYVKSEDDAPLRFRMNRGGGELGPERLFPFTEIRNYAIADPDRDGRADVAAVRRRSGRLAVLKYAGEGAPAPTDRKAELELSTPRMVAYAVQKEEKPRDELVVDLDGDGRPELLVAEPSAARLVVHRADPVDGLSCKGEVFPSFVGARHPCAADLDGDGKLEIVVAAPEEGAIGVAKVDAAGKLSFPEPLGFKGESLLAIDVADVDGSGKPSVMAVIANGKGGARSWKLARVASAGAEATEIDLGKLPTDPTALWLIDLDRDGMNDALIFLPTEMPRILLGKSVGGKRSFEELKAADVPGLGILKSTARSSMHYGDVDGDGAKELLVPGPNFARAFTLGAKGVPTVVGQWNLDDTGAKVGAVAAGDLDGDGKPEIVLTEKSTKTLRVLRLADGAVRTLARVELGDLDPKGLRIVDVDKSGAQDVVLLCADRFALLQSGRDDPGLVETTDFETPLKNAFLDEVAFGDVNSDGVTDAVITETSEHRIAIAAWVDGALAHVIHFPVYEESIFERDGGGGKEPRELVLADLTGDQKTDVAILVHDRVIVYPQE